MIVHQKEGIISKVLSFIKSIFRKNKTKKESLYPGNAKSLHDNVFVYKYINQLRNYIENGKMTVYDLTISEIEKLQELYELELKSDRKEIAMLKYKLGT